MTKGASTKIRPTTRRTLRALSGRRIVIEGYGRRAPVYVAIAGSSDVPVGAWISTAELRKLVDVAKRILK